MMQPSWLDHSESIDQSQNSKRIERHYVFFVDDITVLILYAGSIYGDIMVKDRVASANR